MKRPLFSCVMPVKGPRPYMDAALDSLRCQGMGDELEIIVQDADIEPDQGQSDALNRGFSKARGEWFFWLNGDDVMLPGTLKRLARLVCCSRHPIDWVAGNVAYLDELGKVTRCAWDNGWKMSCWGLPVQVYGPSSFFRRELFEECGPFDVALHYTMDVDMWCKFRNAGYWYRKLDALAWGFRIHSGSKTHEAQMGGWPECMAKEHEVLDARHGFNHIGMSRRFANLTRIVNGSYVKTWWNTRRSKGHDWKTL